MSRYEIVLPYPGWCVNALHSTRVCLDFLDSLVNLLWGSHHDTLSSGHIHKLHNILHANACFCTRWKVVLGRQGRIVANNQFWSATYGMFDIGWCFAFFNPCQRGSLIFVRARRTLYLPLALERLLDRERLKPVSYPQYWNSFERQSLGQLKI